MTTTHPSGAPALDSARALAELARAAGLEWNRAAFDSSRAVDEGSVPLEPLDWLVHAAADCDLHLEAVELERERLAEWLDGDRPLLTASPAAEAVTSRRWILLRRDGNEVRIATFSGGERDERGVPLEQLPEALDLDGTGPVRWLTTGPRSVRFRTETPGDVNLPPFRRLLKMLRPDRRDLLAVAAFSVAMGVLLLATPIAVQALVNFVALGGAIPPLLVVVFLLFLGLGFAGVLSATQTWVVELLQRRIYVRTVAELAARLPAVSLTASTKRFGPELVNRYFDLATIQKTGSFLLLDGLSVLLSVLVGLVVLAFYHPLLLAFDILLLAVITLIVLGPIRRGIRTARAESSAKYEVAAWLEEIAANPTMFKSSGVMKAVFERSDHLVHDWVERRASHFRVVFGQSVAAIALQVLASTALLGIGGWLVIQGNLTLGQLVAAELILTLVVSSVAKMGKHLEAFYDLMAATDKVGVLLDVPVERTDGHQLEPQESSGASLELREVTWTPHAGAALISGVSLRVEAGERVGIQGATGSGKSTLLRLVWGTLTPQAGSVHVDGQDLRDLSLDSLRRAVSLIDREEFFSGSVRDNVRLGRPFVTEEDVRDALDRVGLLDELSLLPEGLDTDLRAGGAPLSKGQLSLLQVARAIAGRPRLLLASDSFDELTKAESERVLDALFDRDAPWTLLFASNSSSAIERCDRNLLLEGGALHEGALAS